MTYCSVVTVLALVGLTRKRFGHYAILKNLTLRSPSTSTLWYQNLNNVLAFSIDSLRNVTDWSIMADSQSLKHCIVAQIW